PTHPLPPAPPLRLQQQAVAVGEAIPGEAAQAGSAAHRWQHVERRRLAILAPRRFRETVKREDPGVAQNRDVLNHFVVDLPEPKGIVAVRVVVARDAIEAATPRVAAGQARVESD